MTDRFTTDPFSRSPWIWFRGAAESMVKTKQLEGADGVPEGAPHTETRSTIPVAALVLMRSTARLIAA
jgi:hypothetical protein